jgi:hypothetical protein
VLFEGGERAVEAQVASARRLVGGTEGDPWAEVLAFQAGKRRRRFEKFDGAMLVRGDQAYAENGGDEPWSPLAERIREAFDPQGRLV